MPFWSWVRKCASNSGVPKRQVATWLRQVEHVPGADRHQRHLGARPSVAFEAHFCRPALAALEAPAEPLAVVFTAPSTTPQPSMAPLVILNVERGARPARCGPGSCRPSHPRRRRATAAPARRGRALPPGPVAAGRGSRSTVSRPAPSGRRLLGLLPPARTGWWCGRWPGRRSASRRARPRRAPARSATPASPLRLPAPTRSNCLIGASPLRRIGISTNRKLSSARRKVTANLAASSGKPPKPTSPAVMKTNTGQCHR